MTSGPSASQDHARVTQTQASFPLFHTISVPMTLTRVSDGHFTDANDSFCKLVGFSRAELIGRTTLELGIQPSLGQRERSLKLFKLQGWVRDHEISIHAKDGTPRVLQSNLDLVHVDGEPHILGVLVDVTARRDVEVALRASEARLRLAIDQCRLGITLSKDGEWTDVNPAFCQMLGYARSELLSLGWRAVTHPEDVDASQRVIESMRSGPERFELTKRYVHKDGRTIWAEVHTNTIRDEKGDATAHFTYIADVTERKRAETEAKRQLVARALVRRILRELLDQGERSHSARRALGRSIAREGTSADHASLLEEFQALNIGELELVGQRGDSYEFRGTNLLEHTPGHGRPTCHLVLGYLEGAVAALHGDSLGTETDCQSQDHAACRFVVKGRHASAVSRR